MPFLLHFLLPQIEGPEPATEDDSAEVRAVEDDPQKEEQTQRSTQGTNETTKGAQTIKDPNDTRSTRDATYDPRATTSPNLRIDGEPTFGLPGSSLALRPIGDEEIGFRPGGLDITTQAAIVEGYNSNVIQTQSVVNGPATNHAAPFTGLDATFQLRFWSSPLDTQEVQLQVRGQYYEPLDGYDVPNDGAVVGAYTGQSSLTKRDVVQVRLISTVATLNSSEVSDGPVFLVEPGSLQRTYTLTQARASITHEITDRLRYRQAVDVAMETTIRDTPIDLGNGRLVQHQGLDYIEPGTDGTLFYDLNPSDVASVLVRLEETRNYFLLDYSTGTAKYAGVGTTLLGEVELGLSHAFSESLRTLVNVGAVEATAPPFDPDQRPYVSPVVSAEALYNRQYWLASGAVGYTYGSTTPRLGFGPSATVSALFQGTPFPHDPRLKKFALLANLEGNRSAFRATGTTVSRLSYLAASAEVRYELSPYLGLLGGYTFRDATFEGADAEPQLIRHVVFFGLTGYFATDRVPPSLTTFAAPVNPG